jgi:Uri superfamily endonuclease
MNTCTTLCRTLEHLPTSQGGTYIVMLWLPARQHLTIGRLGAYDLPRGYYRYAGSAQRGLASRLHRHLHGATTRHWHLDYLRPHARVMAWRAYADNSQPECQLAQRLLAWGQIVIPRFGASDCSCPSQLLYYPRRSHAEWGIRHAECKVANEESGTNSWRGINKIK